MCKNREICKRKATCGCEIIQANLVEKLGKVAYTI